MRGAVSKSLEMTEEQERHLRQMIEGFGSASPMYDAGVAWDIIRDMALEAAAQECEAHQGHGLFFGRLVRDLKGTP